MCDKVEVCLIAKDTLRQGIFLRINIAGHKLWMNCLSLCGYDYTVCAWYSDVKLISEVFQSLNGDDKRLQKVRVILLAPRCSVSAVSNPVDFILQENGGTVL